MPAKFPHARRKVKIAAGVAKATSRTHFGLITMQGEIAAACSRNGFLESPFLKKQTQFFPILAQKRLFGEKQSQNKPNSKPNLYLFMQNEPKLPPFSAQKPRFHQKTNPKQTQTKPFLEIKNPVPKDLILLPISMEDSVVLYVFSHSF